MTDDIVARLRDWSITSHTLEQEAADEIERLRAELAAARKFAAAQGNENEELQEELDKTRDLLRDAASALYPFSDWLDAKRGVAMEHFNRAANVVERISKVVEVYGYGDE